MTLNKKLGLVMIFLVLALFSVSTVEAGVVDSIVGGYNAIKTAFTETTDVFKQAFGIFTDKDEQVNEGVTKRRAHLTNTLLVTALLYLIIMPFILKEKTPTATIPTILMLLILFILSYHMTSGLDNYIWKLTEIKNITDMFIGDKGVLKGGRLMIFIGGTALIYWLLDFMNVGGKEGMGGRINFVLALIMGINIAQQAEGENYFCNIVKFGMFIGMIIFSTNIHQRIGKEGKGSWIISIFLAFILVAWVSQVMFPECTGAILNKPVTVGEEADEPIGGDEEPDEEIEGVSVEKDRETVATIKKEGGVVRLAGNGMFDKIFGVGWWLTKFFFSNIKRTIIIGIIVGILWWIMSRKEGMFRRIRGDLRRNVFGRVKSLIRKNRIWGLGWLLRLPEWQDSSPENEFLFVFRKLRTELQAQMDFMLRWEVYTVKFLAVIYAKKRILEKLEPDLKQTHDFGEIKRDMDIYKKGLDIGKNRKGEFIIKKTLYKWKNDWGEDKVSENVRLGFNTSAWLISKIMNDVKTLLQSRNLFAEMDVDDAKKKATDDTEETLKKQGFRMYDETDPESKSGWKEHKSALKKYANFLLINNLLKCMLDQFLNFGEYEHSYRFANPEAEWFSAPIYENEKNGALIVEIEKAAPTGEKVGFKRKGRDEKGEPKDKGRGYLLYEVSERGVSIEDLNEIRVEGKKANSVRVVRDIYDKGKLKKKGIVNYTFFSDIMKWSEEEWKWFIEDVRAGIFHPLSRTQADYSRIIGDRKYGFEVKRESSPDYDNAAFDREALKDHGRFVYWGRKEYDSVGDKSIETEGIFINRFPGISVLGFASYIEELTKKMEEDQEEKVRFFLEKFVYPTGAIDKDLFAGSPEKKEGGG